MAEGEWGWWLHPQGKAAPSNGSCCTHLHVAGLGGVGLKVKNLPHFALKPPQIWCVGGVLGGGVAWGRPSFPSSNKKRPFLRPKVPLSAAQSLPRIRRRVKNPNGLRPK